MPRRSRRRSSANTSTSRIGHVLEKFEEAKQLMNKETKKLRENKKKVDNVLDALDQRLDEQIQKWTDLIMRNEDHPQFQQLAELVKSLPKPDAVEEDSEKLEDLSKSMRSLSYRAKRTAELCEETEPIQEKAENEARQLRKALKDMTKLEKKHKELLGQWTVEESLSEEEAKRLVMNAADKVKEKDPQLAEDLKKYAETSTGFSGSGEEDLPQHPSSHTVYVPSSDGAGTSTSGFQYKD